MRKRAFILIFTLAAITAVFAFFMRNEKSVLSMDGISFYHSDIKGIRLCETSLENVYNLFVPGCADHELYVSCPDSMKLVLDDADILENGGEITSRIKNISDEGIPYVALRAVTDDGREIFNGYINFFYTSKLPSVYITLPEEDIESINAENPEGEKDKLYASGTIEVFDEEGKRDTASRMELSRRGNTSFLHMDAKPYNINLKDSVSILGMKRSRKYALKANSYDMNHLLRNEAALDLARLTGMEAAVDSRYADVFINGTYNGLYLLCGRIKGEEFPEALSGGYLLELDYRYKTEEKYFESHGQGIVVQYPLDVSDAQLDYIRSKYEEAYDAVNSDGEYEDFIDVESFLKMYMIQDLFCNVDVDYASFFFYLGDDGLFHAGPVWDFDLATGIMQTLPFHEELAKRSHIIPDRGGIFLGLLEKSPRFKKRLAEYYLKEFMPLMYEYAAGTMMENGERTAQSLQTSDIVHRFYFRELHSLDSVEGLYEWMRDRGELLRKYYEAPDEYDSVTFSFAWGDIRTLSRHGEPLGYLPDNYHPDNEEDFWGEVTGFAVKSGDSAVSIDDSYIPEGDTVLHAVYSEDSHALEEGYVNITSVE